MGIAEADQALLLWFNGLSGHFRPLDFLMRGFATDYLLPVSLALSLLGLWFMSPRERSQKAVICAGIALGLANFFVKMMNLVYFRPRPFSELELNLLFYRPHDSSFPSNAAAVGFAFAVGVCLFYPKASWVFFVLASLFALSRVYVGIHYPFDILGGAAIGALAACISWLILKTFDRYLSRVLELARRFYLA